MSEISVGEEEFPRDIYFITEQDSINENFIAGFCNVEHFDVNGFCY